MIGAPFIDKLCIITELPTNEAFVDEYLTSMVDTRLEHIRDIRFDGTVHNNKMERMNGEIRDREKVMGRLERKGSPILTGVQIYHNFVKPHMALEGKTPAEAAGIKVEGKDKLMTIIQNAAKRTLIRNSGLK